MNQPPQTRRRGDHKPPKRQLLDEALEQTRKAKGPQPDYPEPEPEPQKRLT
jgi:hypothetical protein